MASPVRIVTSGKNVDVSDNNPFPIQIRDVYGHGTAAAVDPITATLAVIDVAHGEIHAGRFFSYSDYIDLPNTGSSTFLFSNESSTKESHLNFITNFEVEGEIVFYHNPTVSANGVETSQVFNRRLGGSTVRETKIYANPTVTSSGSLLLRKRVGSGKAEGGNSRSDEELIVPAGDSLLVIVYNRATGANNLFDFEANWYEVDEFTP
jgi:hypothetical protein